MRLHFLLLSLFASLEVLALGVAAPWEMMYFYSVYKAEWLAAFTKSQRQLATNCVRSTTHPFPASDFDTQAALAGNMWNVDQYWSTLMKKFEEFKIPGGYEDDLQKLLPKAGFVGLKEEFPPAIKMAADALYSARAAVAGATAVEAQAGYAMEYTRIAMQLRVGDGLYIHTEPNPFTLQLKPTTVIPPPAGYQAPSIASYTGELDWDKTIDLNPDGSRNGANGPQKNGLKRYYQKNYATTTRLKIHNDVIQAFQQARNYITDNRPKCALAAAATVGKKRDLLYSEQEEDGTPEATGSQIGNRYSSHLVPMPVKFKQMNVVLAEQPSSSLVRMDMGALSA
ncbi:uncharacterized protein LY89DRAFT_750092 [Mollisia scopiformis]|uniref:Uncharacterized protein n=1 Tax=Mollisia scopiformis TaxID=149040 RepID=A0A194X737_MOLSC|nr:uncharacterized protein LY89DRAFT_750092 [Mollisia scopiformis]KUJ15983.1 hypothetical protein LY89DRAFT_750092 [Mollisia scopiformis]